MDVFGACCAIYRFILEKIFVIFKKKIFIPNMFYVKTGFYNFKEKFTIFSICMDNVWECKWKFFNTVKNLSIFFNPNFYVNFYVSMIYCGFKKNHGHCLKKQLNKNTYHESGIKFICYAVQFKLR